MSLGWEINSFPVIFSYRRLNFLHSLWIFPIYSWFIATATEYWKYLSFLLIGFTVALLLFIQLGQSIYDESIWIYFMTFLMNNWTHNKWTQSKIKSLVFIEVSNPTWYLDKGDWKSSSVTSSALPLIMISMLSLWKR